MTEFKAPQDAIDGIPQERITSLTRGRGPRRGNLEALLKYWRPIMRKPGGFRRCLVILADHPELYPLPPLCAWLHHETTGKWPNEGKKKRGRRVVRRSVPGRRRRRGRGRKDGDYDIEVARGRLERRLARESGSVIYKRLDGSREQLEYKASRIGRAIESILLPGERHMLRFSPTRRIAYNLLSPGGDRNIGPRIGGGPRGRALRCPPGFQFGGRFANSRLSNCGARLFQQADLEGLTPSPARVERATQTVRSQVRRDIRDSRPSGGRERVGVNRTQVRRIGDIRRNRSAFDIVREAAVHPVKKSNRSRQDRTARGLKLKPGETRLVRRDGSVLAPLTSVSTLARQKDNDDLKDGVFVRRVDGPNFDVNDVDVMAAGVRQVMFITKDGKVIAITRKGRPLTPTEVRSLRRRSSRGKGAEGLSALASAMPGRLEVDGDAPDVAEGLSETIARVNKGGSLLDVPPAQLPGVVKGSKARRKGNTITAPNGDRFILSGTSGQGHISRRAAADILDHLGVETTEMTFYGTGSARRLMQSHPDNLPKGKGKVSDAPLGDRFRILLADFLLDNRSRNASSLRVTPKGIAAVGFDRIGAIGSSRKRASMSLAAFLREQDEDVQILLRENQENVRRARRRVLSSIFNNAIRRADSWSWREYYALLNRDGEMSDAERVHLRQVQRVYETRLKTLRRSRDLLLGGGEEASQKNLMMYRARAFSAQMDYQALTMEMAKARVVWDRGIARFRCPPGTPNGGTITNRLGSNCGHGRARRLLNRVIDAGDRAVERASGQRAGSRAKRRAVRKAPKVTRKRSARRRIERRRRSINIEPPERNRTIIDGATDQVDIVEERINPRRLTGRQREAFRNEGAQLLIEMDHEWQLLLGEPDVDIEDVDEYIAGVEDPELQEELLTNRNDYAQAIRAALREQYDVLPNRLENDERARELIQRARARARNEPEQPWDRQDEVQNVDGVDVGNPFGGQVGASSDVREAISEGRIDATNRRLATQPRERVDSDRRQAVEANGVWVDRFFADHEDDANEWDAHMGEEMAAAADRLDASGVGANQAELDVAWEEAMQAIEGDRQLALNEARIDDGFPELQENRVAAVNQHYDNLFLVLQARRQEIIDDLLADRGPRDIDIPFVALHDEKGFATPEDAVDHMYDLLGSDGRDDFGLARWRGRWYVMKGEEWAEVLERQRQGDDLQDVFMAGRWNRRDVMEARTRGSDSLGEVLSAPVQSDLRPERVMDSLRKQGQELFNKRLADQRAALRQQFGDDKPWKSDHKIDDLKDIVDRYQSGDGRARTELLDWANRVWGVSHRDGEYQIEMDHVEPIVGGVKITGNVYHVDANGNRRMIGEIRRRINPGKKTIEHEYFNISREQHRGNGLGSLVTARSLAFYRAAGFEKVTVGANISWGGYVWARQGFDWASRDSEWNRGKRVAWVQLFRDNLDGMPLNDAQRARLGVLIKQAEDVDYNPRKMPAPYQWALFPGAKEVLQNFSWQGELDLRKALR